MKGLKGWYYWIKERLCFHRKINAMIFSSDGAHSGAFPGFQACRDLLAATDTGEAISEGSTECTSCWCGTYLLPWGHRDPPDTVRIGGVAVWKARG